MNNERIEKKFVFGKYREDFLETTLIKMVSQDIISQDM